MRTDGRAFAAMLCFGTFCFAAHAGPLVLEETARIPSPERGVHFSGEVAVEGDWLVPGSRHLAFDHGSGRDMEHAVFVNALDGSP